MRSAWKELGALVLKECAGGDKAGLCWIPISQYPVTARLSYAGLGHYAVVNEIILIVNRYSSFVFGYYLKDITTLLI